MKLPFVLGFQKWLDKPNLLRKPKLKAQVFRGWILHGWKGFATGEFFGQCFTVSGPAICRSAQTEGPNLVSSGQAVPDLPRSALARPPPWHVRAGAVWARFVLWDRRFGSRGLLARPGVCRQPASARGRWPQGGFVQDVEVKLSFHHAASDARDSEHRLVQP